MDGSIGLEPKFENIIVITMNSFEDRNPSPPPEILENDEDFVPDRIGNSMYSKRWLYKTLMKMLEVVEEHADVEKDTEDSSSKSVEKGTEDSSSKSVQKRTKNSSLQKRTKNSSPRSPGSKAEESLSKSNGANDSIENIVELDKKVEEDACTLWDMSANFEVAEFLCECSVADIFLTIIERTKSPRLLEIVVGILGNMSSFLTPCIYILRRNTDLIKAVIMLSGCTDSCTLVQVFRLLSCVITEIRCKRKCYELFVENSPFMENVKNILENNLCHDVLVGVLQFLNRLLDKNLEYCQMWIEDSYFMAIIESGKQLLKCNQYGDLDSFWSVLWSIYDADSQNYCEPAFVDHFLDLKPLFEAYILKLGEEEIEETPPQPEKLWIIGHVFHICSKLIIKKAMMGEYIKLDNDVLKAAMHAYRLLDGFLEKHKRKGNYDSSGEEVNNAVSSTQTAKRNRSHEAEAEESITRDDIMSAKDAHANIRMCLLACFNEPKDAEGFPIIDEDASKNNICVPDVVEDVGKH